MFKKSNDRLGNPVKDKIRLGQPESVKIRSESRTGNPTLADNNRLGQPENYAENQSESRGQPEITEMLSETRLGNPTQTGDQELIESESRSSDLMEFPSETSLIGTPTSSLIIQTSSPRTKIEYDVFYLRTRSSLVFAFTCVAEHLKMSETKNSGHQTQ